MIIKMTEEQLVEIIKEIVSLVLTRLNRTLLVEHMSDSSKYEPRTDATWKDYWERKTKRSFPSQRTECACCGELTEPKDFVGSHVVNVNNRRIRYIYPLCAKCNDTYGKGKRKSPKFYVNVDDCVRWYSRESKVVKPTDKR